MSRVALRPEIERSQIMTLGRSDPGWSFLALAAQELRVAGSDDELRLLAAKALEKLGLVRLAWETAESIVDPALRLERDRILDAHRDGHAMTRDELVKQVCSNAAVLDAPWLHDAIEGWLAEGTEYHRARDGNVVRQTARGAGLAGCEWLEDVRSEARAFCAAHLHQASRVATGPIVIEGLSPPWVALAVADATPKLSDGYQPPLVVVQSCEREFVEGLALCDSTSVLRRAKVFTGSNAEERFREWIRGRFSYDAIGGVIPIRTLRTRVEPALSVLMQDLGKEQRRVADELRSSVAVREAQRDVAYWSARFAEDRTRRVLIPTTRYSTYIQYASRDLAAGFEALGWEARLMIEPDDGSRFSTIAYLREHLDFDPDLIVLINWPRATRLEAFPTGTPFVCWIQDSMPHLFDARVGHGHAERDFVMGHIYPSLFAQYGYPPERALSTPVVASDRKFHPASVCHSERYECEIAYVSHHSETPESMHARLRSESGDPQIVRVLDAMRDLIVERYAEICGMAQPKRIKSIPREAWVRVRGSEPDARTTEQLREQYLVPIIERMLRHEMLCWAVQIAERRNWRVKIFGRGWEFHSKFGQYACGVLEHGDDLRAAYQAAGVHLHASMTTLVHQRVMECALSGGLPGCRLIGANMGQSRQRALARVVKHCEPDRARLSDGFLGYDLDRHKALRSLQEMCEGVGHVLENTLWIHPQTYEHMRKYGVAFEVATPEDLFGTLECVTFSDEAGLERFVEHAVSNPRWRAQRSKDIAGRVRSSFTHEGLARRAIELVESAVRV